MTFHETGLINFVQIFWVVSLYILVRLAIRRVKPNASLADWSYETQVSKIRSRGNIMTLLKIYSKVSRSTPRELALNLRDELSSNAATFYKKPKAYFVKYRTNDKVMSKYFEDAELRAFFKDPRSWASFNGAVRERFFGLIQDDSRPSENYYSNLFRIVSKFENAIAVGKQRLMTTENTR